jgi:hypothetical protein
VIRKPVIRTRTARLLTTAVLGSAVLAGTPGCGGPMQAGAAVIVDGNRVTDGQIQTQVAQVSALQTKYGDPQPPAADALAREQVNWIVLAGAYDKAAASLGVTPSAEALAQTHAQMVTEARQQVKAQLSTFDGSDDEAIALSLMMGQSPIDVAPAGIPTMVRLQADYAAITKQLAAKPGATQTTVTSDWSALLASTAPHVDVTVSPRYGTYDVARLAAQTAPLTTAPPSWIRGAATPATPAPPAQG